MAKRKTCTCSDIDISDLKLPIGCSDIHPPKETVTYNPLTGRCYNQHGQFIGEGKYIKGTLTITRRKYDWESKAWKDGLDMYGNVIKKLTE